MLEQTVTDHDIIILQTRSIHLGLLADSCKLYN